jgi:hypothetical protein
MPQYLFVENEGVGLNPGPLGTDGCPNWFCEDRPQSIDMIGALYERGDQVKPDEPNELMQLFPMTGEYANSTMGYSGASGRQVYRAHARLRRFIQGPTRRSPMGRLIVTAGNHSRWVLVDDDLMIRSSDDPSLLIPKVSYHAARFFPKMNEWWGQSVVVPLKSPQRRINMSLSQLVMNRERNGNDGWLVTPGMRVTAPGWSKQYPGNINVWQKDPENPGERPIPQQSRLMDPGVYQELEFSIRRMQVIAGYADVNQGKTPAGVTAGTAIEQLANQSAERPAATRSSTRCASSTRSPKPRRRSCGHCRRASRPTSRTTATRPRSSWRR